MTPDQIRSKYTDAANDIENAGFADGYATAMKEEADRKEAILAEFSDDMPFAYKCVTDGVSLDDARKQYTAHVKAENARLAAEVEAARKLRDELDNGVDAVQLGTPPVVEKTEEEQKRERVQAEASKLKTTQARNDYLTNAGFDPAEFSFTN